jgi:DNA-binding response OmpR family regulator
MPGGPHGAPLSPRRPHCVYRHRTRRRTVPVRIRSSFAALACWRQHLLARHPGRVYSREDLLQRIWGLKYVGMDRTVDSHVGHLRKKLGPFGDRVTTVWGVGYKLRAD